MFILLPYRVLFGIRNSHGSVDAMQVHRSASARSRGLCTAYGEYSFAWWRTQGMTVVPGVRRFCQRFTTLALVGAVAHVSPEIVLAQQGGATTLKATSRNVILDIAVTDYRGRPVTDLSDSDLVVKENGELQTVHIASTSSRARGSDSLGGTGSGLSNVRKESTAAGPRAALTAGPRTVILLDEVNNQFFDLAFARQRLEVFLRGPKAQGRPIAILAMTSRREILVHDFSTDTAALIDSLHRLPGALPATGSGGMISGNVDAINDMENLQKSMGVLVQFASAFSGSGERVNVI
jgi:hypothetical protein